MSQFNHNQSVDTSVADFVEANIFEPTTLATRFEQLATGHVVSIYRTIIESELLKTFKLDKGAREVALEEWDYVALCLDRAPTPEDELKYGDMLEKIRPKYALQQKLSESATWNEIIIKALSSFDEPIAIGVEKNWPWARVLQLERDTDHIDTALRFGAHPDISPVALLDLIRESAWASELEVSRLREESLRTFKEIAKRIDELTSSIELTGGAIEDIIKALEVIKESLRIVLREQLAHLWDRKAESVKDEEIQNFLDSTD